MDTTDKQNPRIHKEDDKWVDKFNKETFTAYPRKPRQKDNADIFHKVLASTPQDVKDKVSRDMALVDAVLKAERQRLRDAVNERMKDYRNGLLHNPPQYKVMDKGAIIALEYVLSLLK